jgi:ATP-binding cassette subfamily G (WHITE) protein 2
MAVGAWQRCPRRDAAAGAAQVMTVVKSLVKSGMTICATIHSPTPYCFNLFDTLMILLRGNVVYFGENGAPRQNVSG